MGSVNNFNVGGDIISMEAENAMTERYVCVEQGTAEGQCDLPDSTADIVIGVIQETAVAGQAVPVQISGLSQVVAGGAIALGARVYLQATTGRVDDVDTGTCVGQAMTASAADGEIIVVDLSHKGAA